MEWGSNIYNLSEVSRFDGLMSLVKYPMKIYMTPYNMLLPAGIIFIVNPKICHVNLKTPVAFVLPLPTGL